MFPKFNLFCRVREITDEVRCKSEASIASNKVPLSIVPDRKRKYEVADVTKMGVAPPVNLI